jgi:hypothetical protein
MSDILNYWPDRLRGGLPLFTFCLWVLIQRDALGTFDGIRSLFADANKTEIGRKAAKLAKGLNPGEPFYLGYVVLGMFIYVLIALSLADAVLPFLTGHSTQAGLAQALGAMSDRRGLVALVEVCPANPSRRRRSAAQRVKMGTSVHTGPDFPEFSKLPTFPKSDFKVLSF